jgi:hypothetical protein
LAFATLGQAGLFDAPAVKIEGMGTKPIGRGLFEWLFNRCYFRSLRSWRVDVIWCFILATVVTPAEPYSLFIVLIVACSMATAWLVTRYAIARNLSKSNCEGRIVGHAPRA